MAIKTVPQLFQGLRAASLLTNAQVDVVAKELLPRMTDPRALARELLKRNWVTPYQINQLFLDRGPDLNLGPYVLLERVGEGGMGQVFKARHRKLNRNVALKVIRRDKLGNAEAVRRFYREVQAASKLDHPNIVTAIDADEVNGNCYFAMEFVEGATLSKLVKQGGPLAVALACEYMRQVTLGLQHAYEKGLVHRDIKPSNIVVQSGGSRAEAPPLVKILDMGLARVLHPDGTEASAELTQAHAILGTPDYISPEQARDAHAADTRSDLYSLGCTFHFALTGEVPFPANSAMEKLLKHYLEEPPRVEALRPEVPVAVGQIVRKLMAKSPDKRFQTPAQLGRALEALLGVGVAVPAAIPMALPIGPAETLPATIPELPQAAPPADDTVPDVSLEFETSDSIQTARARTAVPPQRPGAGSYVVAGLAFGLLAVLLALLLRFLLH